MLAKDLARRASLKNRSPFAEAAGSRHSSPGICCPALSHQPGETPGQSLDKGSARCPLFMNDAAFVLESRELKRN